MLKKYILELARLRTLKDFSKLVFELWQNKQIRFLAVGASNTLVCYLFGLVYFAIIKADPFKITIFNIITTINSYLMHKFFSFNKRGYSFKELLRAIIAYGTMYIISIYLIMGLIHLGYSQLVAYHINLIFSIIYFYLVHSYFTFR